MNYQIKICGITNLEDAFCAIHNGANALGFVFYKKSPRFICLDRVSEIVNQLPPFFTAVGLVVNFSIEEIHQIIDSKIINLLQFHGDESPEFCESFNFPYIKAVRVHQNTNLYQICNDFKSARAILVDAFVDGIYGGTGKTFDWSLIPKDLSKPIILAGGLSVENVKEAVDSVNPYAIDVSGGVETSQKGIKDHNKIKDFINQIR